MAGRSAAALDVLAFVGGGGSVGLADAGVIRSCTAGSEGLAERYIREACWPREDKEYVTGGVDAAGPEPVWL